MCHFRSGGVPHRHHATHSGFGASPQTVQLAHHSYVLRYLTLDLNTKAKVSSLDQIGGWESAGELLLPDLLGAE